MTNRQIVSVAVAAALFAIVPNRASAQEEPAPAAPPAAPPTAAPGATVVATPPPGAVRVNFHTGKSMRTAQLYIRQGDRYVPVCAAPCTADIAPDAQLRAVLDGKEDDPTDFSLGEGPRARDIEVKKGGQGMLIGGIVTAGAGGGAALSGLLFFAVASAVEEQKSTINWEETADLYRVMGYTMLGIGAAAVTIGLLMIATRSTTPKIRQTSAPASFGKREAVGSPVGFSPFPLSVRF